MPTLPAFILGFILGLKHAFEADHILAVSTIVTEHKKPLHAMLVGAFWGIGHTTTLFITGILVLLLKVSISENLSLSLEALVGLMLIILGLRALKKSVSSEAPKHSHKMPFIVGLIHGLAGSGALMLLVLSTIPSVMGGLYYILLFGAGSILGMSLMSLIIGVPFSYSSPKLPKIEGLLRVVAGVFSIIFGVFVIYRSSQSLF